MILILNTLNRPDETNFVLATIEKNGITSVTTIDFPGKKHFDEDKMLAIALADVLQLPEEGWSTELGAMVRENRAAIKKEIEEWNEQNVYSEDIWAPEYDLGEELIEISDESEEH